MNQEQKKYLKERLAAAVRSHRDNGPKPPQEPASVKAARRVVQAWDRSHRYYDHDSARRGRIEKAAAKVRETVLFAEAADKALKAVSAFEQRVFK